MSLQTFAVKNKTVQSTKVEKNAMIKADRNLFARMLVIAQSRHLNMKEVLEYELGPIPWSIATTSGSLVKTNKSVLSGILGKNVDPVQNLPESCVLIFDIMATIQSLTKIPDTFEELANSVLNSILHVAKPAVRIDVVGDQYPDISIKDIERHKRAASGQIITKITRPSQPCPRQWKKFLSVGENKTALIDFFLGEWSKQCYKDKLVGKQVFVAHGNLCHEIRVSDGIVTKVEIPNLNSNHVEADTKMFLHAKHAASSGHTSIVIKSPDTDVFVLACYYQLSIDAKLFILTGTSARSRIVDISSICHNYGRDTCIALPGLHAISGCDSVSALSGKGKTKAFKVMLKNAEFSQILSKLGDNFAVSACVIDGIERFLCSVYGFQLNNINDVRFYLFCKAKNVQCHQLPPTKDALVKHIQRANYQTKIWKDALIANVCLPSPAKHGWNIKDNTLSVHWIDKPPASEALLLLISCGCKSGCTNRRCTCFQQGLSCTDGCKCNSVCQNISVKESLVDTDDSDDGQE